MKKIYYYQCLLRKKLENSSLIQVSWIPEKYSVKDKYIRLKNKDKKWSNGWQVVDVGKNRKTEEYIIANELNYMHQRKVSDR